MTLSLRAASLALAGTLLALPGCSKTDDAPPVATITLTPNKRELPVGSPIELTYRFEVAPTANITGDYRVFMHVNRGDGSMIWSDDHDLPAEFATSKWKPGQVIEYTRTRFVPASSYLGTATLTMGLYKDEDRLTLAGPDPADQGREAREYTVGTLNLRPRSESITLVKLDGWHPAEFSPEDATLEWQWTRKVATMSLRNPKRDLMLWIEFDARPDLFADSPQKVTVYAGGTAVGTLTADRQSMMLEKLPIPASLLTGDMAEIRLEVDRTFIPAKLTGGSGDPRELGIRVFNVFVEAR
jgi:hypothetical protein